LIHGDALAVEHPDTHGHGHVLEYGHHDQDELGYLNALQDAHGHA